MQPPPIDSSVRSAAHSSISDRPHRRRHRQPVLAKNGGGSVTLFAFDAGQGLTAHTTPFDALVLALEGTFNLTIGGPPVSAAPGTIVRLPPPSRTPSTPPSPRECC